MFAKLWSRLLHYGSHHFLWVIVLPLLFYGGDAPSSSLSSQAPASSLPSLPATLPAYPINDGTPPPILTAEAVLVQDSHALSHLYVQGLETRLPPASTTKLMTALAALALYPDLETKLVVKTEDHTLGQTMDLYRGESISVRALLSGLLIRSANDAALTLANNAPGGYDGFVAKMNQLASEFGLSQTTYKNPSGLDQYDHLTTARDLALLMRRVVQVPLLVELMQQPSLLVTDATGRYSHYLETTDQLLGIIPGLVAGKTGYTLKAGECLVTYVERDNRGIITVVLNSRDRFGETRALIDWAFDHHTWLIPPLL